MSCTTNSHINAFIDNFEKFLKINNMPNIKGLDGIVQINDLEYINDIIDKCSEYIYEYIKCHLCDKFVQREIIIEYGFKKLIDLICHYHGDEICEELFDMDDNMSFWIHMLLMNVASLY